MQEYLTKHKLKTKEDIAQHIVELKRNTYPDLELISSLCSYLFDGENNVEELSLCQRDWSRFMVLELKNPAEKNLEIAQRKLNNHVKEIIERGASTRHKSQNGETHKEIPPHPTKEELEKVSVEKLNNFMNLVTNGKNCRNGNVCFCDGSCKKPSSNFLDGEKKQYTEPIFKDNPNLGENTYTISREETEDYITISIHISSTPEQAEKIKAIVDEFNNQNNTLEVGKKENKNKTDYSEIDWDIIDLMAKRFNDNKHKYPQGNMLKPIDKKELLFASFRHLRKMIQPIDNDEETFQEHLTAVLCNMQMVYQQDKLNKS